MTHDIDNFELTNKIVDEKFNGLNTKMILKFQDVSGLVHDFHDIFGSFFVVDSVDAGLGEAL